MLSKRATIEVLENELTCFQCGSRLVPGRKIAMLQMGDHDIEPWCIRCLVQVILESKEIFFVLDEGLPVYKGEPGPRR